MMTDLPSPVPEPAAPPEPAQDSINPRGIIAQAWAITLREPQLRRWGLVAAFLETLLSLKLFIYQTWFFISYINGNPIGFFSDVEWLSERVSMSTLLIIIISFLLLLSVEWVFPHFAKGAIIGLAAKSYKKEEVKGGLVLSIYNFFPLFAIHEAFFLGGISMVITLSSIMLRYAEGIAPFGIFLLILGFIITNILRFFFVMSEEAVVIRKVGIKAAMRGSFKLVISYLGHVVFLMILGLLISIRIVLNILIIFLVPGIVIGLGFVLSTFLSQTVTFIIGGMVGLLIVGFTSYLLAYMEVFRQNVWTITYLELSKLKELDVIEG